MSCGVGRRRGSDPALLWLWCRPMAIALVGPLAWEPPYAVEAALEKKKRQKKKTKKKKFKRMLSLCWSFYHLGFCPIQRFYEDF